MNAVHLNGVVLLEGVDYSISRTQISFAVPPKPYDTVVVTTVIPGTDVTHMECINGDGKKFLFPLDNSFMENVAIQQALKEAWQYKDHSAVADVLEKLRVVIELVKQDAPLHKR